MRRTFGSLSRVLTPALFAVAVCVPALASAQSGARTAPPGSSSAGTATSTGSTASSTSGSNSGGNTGSSGGSSGSVNSGGGSGGGGGFNFGSSSNNGPSGARNSSGRPVIGTATVRTAPTGSGGPGDGFGGGFFPWYTPVVFDFNPWGYGYRNYYYSPFLYDPFFYGRTGYGYGYGYGYSPTPSYSTPSAPSVPRRRTGDIRFKVDPETATVIVDGVSVGEASAYSGLTSHHLVLEVGSHQVEIRASGYETLTKTVVVEAGKTMTERISLKRAKK